MWSVEMLLWAKAVVDRNCTGVFAFLGAVYLFSSLVVRLGTTVTLICGVLHSAGEHKGIWKQNRETSVRPHAEPWHPEALPLDINPAVYPVTKSRRKGSLPGRSRATRDCREGMEGLVLKPW